MSQLNERHCDSGSPPDGDDTTMAGAVWAQGRAAATAAATWRSVVSADRIGAARRVFGTDLDHLTDDDRRLIHAVTGEVIWRGQAPHERPLSAFAMQIAVDRRTGDLPTKTRIDIAYLNLTRARLADLGAPANPFTGANFERAKEFLTANDPSQAERGSQPERRFGHKRRSKR